MRNVSDLVTALITDLNRKPNYRAEARVLLAIAADADLLSSGECGCNDVDAETHHHTHHTMHHTQHHSTDREHHHRKEHLKPTRPKHQKPHKHNIKHLLHRVHKLHHALSKRRRRRII